MVATRMAAILLLIVIVQLARAQSMTDDEDVYEDLTDIRFLYQCVDQHNLLKSQLAKDPRQASNSVEFRRDLVEIATKRAFKFAISGKLNRADQKPNYAENAAWTNCEY